jgi:hypothetical protein
LRVRALQRESVGASGLGAGGTGLRGLSAGDLISHPLRDSLDGYSGRSDVIPDREKVILHRQREKVILTLGDGEVAAPADVNTAARAPDAGTPTRSG